MAQRHTEFHVAVGATRPRQSVFRDLSCGGLVQYEGRILRDGWRRQFGATSCRRDQLVIVEQVDMRHGHLLRQFAPLNTGNGPFRLSVFENDLGGINPDGVGWQMLYGS